MYRGKDPFLNRYRVEGLLTCRTPLHAGDGEHDASFAERAKKLGLEVSDDSREAGYATTATGYDGKPIIPGSSIKGILRHWLRERAIEEPAITAVFGIQASGGKAVFRDARWQSGPELERGFRWFDPDRGTCLDPHVVLDPRTGSAKPGLLYYTEFVPEGSVFRVEIEGQNWTDDDLNLVLFALSHAFEDRENPARVGAEQAGHWGEMRWQLTDVKVLEKADRDRWMEGPVCSYERAFRSHLKQHPDLEKVAASRWKTKETAGVVDLDVELRFEGAFLVNDPSQAQRRGKEADSEGVSHVSIRKVNGEYYLPQSSVRGALRSQARKIWQTMAWEGGGNLSIAERERKKTEARNAGKVAHMAPFFRFVGATGWRSPLEIPDFALVGKPVVHQQEFVAIDRFTGGAADERKFKGHGLYSPVFQGRIRVRVDRWVKAGVGGWGWIWLAFLLRDWMEGDIGMGFGIAKGYGECTAEVSVRGSGWETELLRGLLGGESGAVNDGRAQEWGREWVAMTQPKEAA
jgi:CRISPR/Cas system CSM-associated protein Csm3 (group 7 of RAMP superfamily)